jgi:hypothetical protein
MIPLKSYISSIVPPNFWYTLILFKSTLVAVLRLHIDLIAYRAIGASSVAFYDTIFDDNEVFTHWISYSSS